MRQVRQAVGLCSCATIRVCDYYSQAAWQSTKYSQAIALYKKMRVVGKSSDED